MQTVEVKNLWNEIEKAVGEVVAPYSLQSNVEIEFEVNGHALAFFGINRAKAGLIIGDDYENPIEVFNSQGGVKWVWANLKRLGII